MLDFNKYVLRHGEFWVQDIVERQERAKGIRAEMIADSSLEERWDFLMNAAPEQRRAAASVNHGRQG